MARYLATSKIAVSCGLDAKSEDEAKKIVLAYLSKLTERLNKDESGMCGLGVKFEIRSWDAGYVEELPF